MDTLEFSLGALLLSDNRCRFRVWAPGQQHVELHLVAPADRRVPLQQVAGGYHEAVVDGVGAGSRYFFRVHGRDRPDPASRYQPQGVHGPSEVVCGLHDWHDRDWKGLPLRDYILYELHVGTFTPEGTFDAVIGRLDDLRELGVTAIEIMPVAQFPGGRNWGYDGVHPFAAQNTYGGPWGLRRLVDACHRKGLAVVLDVVYNHLGPEGNYLAEFAPYFTRRYRTDWGEALNFDGPDSDAVRRYFLENALYWLRDLHIDALRLDATGAIQDATAHHFLEQLSEAVDAESVRQGRPLPLLAESLSNDPRVVRSRADFGHGLHGHWGDDFHHALHALLTGERQGYYQDFGRLDQLAQTYRQGYYFTGQYCAFRGRRFGRAPEHVEAEQFVVYAQNHDQVGNRRVGDRLTALLPPEALRLAAAATLLSPHVPLLFMGEEYGETAPFPFFISHGDGRLIDAVRRGRRAEFAGQWNGDVPDPQDERTFRSAKLRWELRHEGKHRALRDFYRELIALRRSHPALAQLSHRHLEVNVVDDVLLLKRWAERDEALAIFRFAATPCEFELPIPLGPWQLRLDSADPRWGGPGSAWPAQVHGPARLCLQPWQCVVLTRSW